MSPNRPADNLVIEQPDSRNGQVVGEMQNLSVRMSRTVGTVKGRASILIVVAVVLGAAVCLTSTLWLRPEVQKIDSLCKSTSAYQANFSELDLSCIARYNTSDEHFVDFCHLDNDSTVLFIKFYMHKQLDISNVDIPESFIYRLYKIIMKIIVVLEG